MMMKMKTTMKMTRMNDVYPFYPFAKRKEYLFVVFFAAVIVFVFFKISFQDKSGTLEREEKLQARLLFSINYNN